jgi:hypothetical protein
VEWKEFGFSSVSAETTIFPSVFSLTTDVLFRSWLVVQYESCRNAFTVCFFDCLQNPETCAEKYVGRKDVSFDSKIFFRGIFLFKNTYRNMHAVT